MTDNIVGRETEEDFQALPTLVPSRLVSPPRSCSCTRRARPPRTARLVPRRRALERYQRPSSFRSASVPRITPRWLWAREVEVLSPSRARRLVGISGCVNDRPCMSPLPRAWRRLTARAHDMIRAILSLYGARRITWIPPRPGRRGKFVRGRTRAGDAWSRQASKIPDTIKNVGYPTLRVPRADPGIFHCSEPPGPQARVRRGVTRDERQCF